MYNSVFGMDLIKLVEKTNKDALIEGADEHEEEDTEDILNKTKADMGGTLNITHVYTTGSHHINNINFIVDNCDKELGSTLAETKDILLMNQEKLRVK